LSLRTGAPALLLGAACALAAPRAHALGPVGVEAGLKVGGGSNPGDTESINPFGFGFGVRGGVTVVGIYGGVSLVDYRGVSEGLVSAKSLLYGIEAGYGVTFVDLLTVRAQIGIGNAAFSGSGNEGSVKPPSDNFLYLEPGLTVLVGLGSFFVGADANVLVLPHATPTDPTSFNPPSSTETAFTAHAQLGVRF
jgi:hypothetical protein